MENLKSVTETRALTLQERKKLVDREGLALEKEVEELSKWVDMIESMDDNQLKNYVKNRPQNLKTAKREKVGTGRRVRQMAKVVEKSKRSDSTSIMASVWKFHKEEEG